MKSEQEFIQLNRVRIVFEYWITIYWMTYERYLNKGTIGHKHSDNKLI